MDSPNRDVAFSVGVVRDVRSKLRALWARTSAGLPPDALSATSETHRIVRPLGASGPAGPFASVPERHANARHSVGCCEMGRPCQIYAHVLFEVGRRAAGAVVRNVPSCTEVPEMPVEPHCGALALGRVIIRWSKLGRERCKFHL